MNQDVEDLFNDWAELAVRNGTPFAEVIVRAEWLGIAYNPPAAIPTSQDEEEAVAGALAMQDWLKTRPT